MAAVSNGKVVVELPLGGMEYLKQIGVAQRSRRSAAAHGRNVDVEQAGRLEVSSSDPEVLPNISQEGSLGNVLVKLNRIKTNPDFIQQVGIERMGPVHDGVLHRLICAQI